MIIKEPQIAVLLAAYNGKRWLEEQIDSILRQNGVVVTLYISVDLSTDGTEEMVFEKFGGYSNVVILNYGKRYGSAASNFFRLIREVEYIKYDYVALADQDDIWFEAKMIKAVEAMIFNKCSAYSSDVIAMWSGEHKRLLKKSYPQTEFDYYFESPGPGCTFVLESTLLSEFHSDFESFEEYARQITTNHDWFIYAYVRSIGESWYIDNHVYMYYRQHVDNEVGMNSGFGAYLHRLKLIRSRWYRKQVKLMFRSFSPDLESKVLNWSSLLSNFYQLRRRPRDKFILGIMILLGIF